MRCKTWGWCSKMLKRPVNDVLDVLVDVEEDISIIGSVVDRSRAEVLADKIVSGIYDDRYDIENRHFFLFEKARIIVYGCEPTEADYDEVLAIQYGSDKEVHEVWDNITE